MDEGGIKRVRELERDREREREREKATFSRGGHIAANYYDEILFLS